MKKTILLLLGLIPLGIGWMVNSWILANPDQLIPGRSLIGVAFLIFWVLIGYLTSKLDKKPMQAGFYANLPAFVMLLILLAGTIVGFLGSSLGVMAQFFFMPFVGISSLLTGWLFRLTGLPASLEIYSILSFLLMIGAYYLGSYLKRKASKLIH